MGGSVIRVAVLITIGAGIVSGCGETGTSSYNNPDSDEGARVN